MILVCVYFFNYFNLQTSFILFNSSSVEKDLNLMDFAFCIAVVFNYLFVYVLYLYISLQLAIIANTKWRLRKNKIKLIFNYLL